LQTLTYIGYFEKYYIQKHTNSHPVKSHFGPPRKIAFLTPGVRDPWLGTTALDALESARINLLKREIDFTVITSSFLRI